MAENNRKIEEAQKKLVSETMGIVLFLRAPLTVFTIAYALNNLPSSIILFFFFQQAEERLAMVEEHRKIEEEKRRMMKEQEERIKEEQKRILGKNKSRPKLSFSLKPVA